MTYLPVLHRSQLRLSCVRYRCGCWTYRVIEMVLLGALLLVPLHNTELGLVLRILHDMPVQCLAHQPNSHIILDARVPDQVD